MSAENPQLYLGAWEKLIDLNDYEHTPILKKWLHNLDFLLRHSEQSDLGQWILALSFAKLDARDQQVLLKRLNFTGEYPAKQTYQQIAEDVPSLGTMAHINPNISSQRARQLYFRAQRRWKMQIFEARRVLEDQVNAELQSK